MKLLTINHFNLFIGEDQKVINSSFSVNSGDVLLLTGPNGCGKSTIIKILMGASFGYKNLDYSGSEIFYKEAFDILYNEKENEYFRRNVCYVSQEDEFESDNVLDCFVNSIDCFVAKKKEEYVFRFIRQYSIQEYFGIVARNVRFDWKGKHLLQILGLDKEQLTEEDIAAVKYLTMSIKRMSGGQKKLTNIFSNLIRYNFCDLIILDEPLNNLDYSNVRAFSNVLTRLYHSKSDLAIILITHCRSIPIVNRIIEIDPTLKAFKESDSYICSSCFGNVDENGLYR